MWRVIGPLHAQIWHLVFGLDCLCKESCVFCLACSHNIPTIDQQIVANIERITQAELFFFVFYGQQGDVRVQFAEFEDNRFLHDFFCGNLFLSFNDLRVSVRVQFLNSAAGRWLRRSCEVLREWTFLANLRLEVLLIETFFTVIVWRFLLLGLSLFLNSLFLGWFAKHISI